METSNTITIDFNDVNDIIEYIASYNGTDTSSFNDKVFMGNLKAEILMDTFSNDVYEYVAARLIKDDCIGLLIFFNKYYGFECIDFNKLIEKNIFGQDLICNGFMTYYKFYGKLYDNMIFNYPNQIINFIERLKKITFRNEAKMARHNSFIADLEARIN